MISQSIISLIRLILVIVVVNYIFMTSINIYVKITKFPMKTVFEKM